MEGRCDWGCYDGRLTWLNMVRSRCTKSRRCLPLRAPLIYQTHAPCKIPSSSSTSISPLPWPGTFRPAYRHRLIDFARRHTRGVCFAKSFLELPAIRSPNVRVCGEEVIGITSRPEQPRGILMPSIETFNAMQYIYASCVTNNGCSHVEVDCQL